MTASACPRPADLRSYSVLGHDRLAKADLGSIADGQRALRLAFPQLVIA